MPATIKHPKRRGEWVEMKFMAAAAARGFTVSKPWGDSARYDFALEYRGRFLRVQVKSTTHRRRNSYICTFGGCYSPQDVDFVAICVIPLDLWYILPAASVSLKRGVMLCPARAANPYRRYLEAWHFLRAHASPRSVPNKPRLPRRRTL